MHTHYTKSLNPETLTRIVLARKIQLVPLIAICSGNKEQHQNNILSLYYCVKWGLKKKKNTNQFGFLQNAGFFFYQLWDDASPSWGGRQTQAKMNDRNVTKIAVRVFHSAKIYYIHSVSSYLHGHEHTKYTESVFPKPKRLIMCLTVCTTSKTNHRWKDGEEDEFHTKNK